MYMENKNYGDMEDKPNKKVGLIKLLVDLRSSGGVSSTELVQQSQKIYVRKKFQERTLTYREVGM